jgi:hypothetical protein
MFPMFYTADSAFNLHSCLITHRRLLESRKQARVFLIACTDLIVWKHLQTFVLLPGKKAYDADEQTRTVLGSLQLWILLGQHHQSKHRSARRHYTEELISSEAQASEGHQEDMSPRSKRRVPVPTSRMVQVHGTPS